MTRSNLLFLFLVLLSLGLSACYANVPLRPTVDEDCDCDDDDVTATDDDDIPDRDGDGYTSVIDCDDFDSSVYPGAPELDNGIDDNCDGQIDEGYGGDDGDNDGDGYSAVPDCDDNNPDVYPGAPEDCDDGIDNDCDGQIDDADSDDCTVTFDGHDVRFMVTYSSATPAIDLSYGYCSDQVVPGNCNAWNQSVVVEAGNAMVVEYTLHNVTGGSLRVNSSRFYSAGDYNSSTGVWGNADSWLCQLGPSGPEMTGSVSVWIDGVYVGNGGAFCFAFGNGSSLGIPLNPLM